MEIFLSFMFLNPSALISYLLTTIPLITYNILLYLAVKFNQQEYHKSKMMMISCLIAIIISVAYIFIPGLGATNVSPEESEILSIFFGLYAVVYLTPYVITQGVILLIFGIKNKEKYRFFIPVAGLLLTIYYCNLLIINFFSSNYEIYMMYNLLFTVLRYIFFAVQINAYIFLLIHGISSCQNIFKVLGIAMISLQTAVFFLFPMIISLVYQIFYF